MNILCVKVFSFGKVGSRIACNINPWYCFTNTCALWIISIRTYSCIYCHSIYILYSIYDMRLKVCVCGGGGGNSSWHYPPLQIVPCFHVWQVQWKWPCSVCGVPSWWVDLLLLQYIHQEPGAPHAMKWVGGVGCILCRRDRCVSTHTHTHTDTHDTSLRSFLIFPVYSCIGNLEHMMHAVVWCTEWVGGVLCGGCAYTHTRKCIILHSSSFSPVYCTSTGVLCNAPHPPLTGAWQECVIGLEQYNLLATFGEDTSIWNWGSHRQHSHACGVKCWCTFVIIRILITTGQWF